MEATPNGDAAPPPMNPDAIVAAVQATLDIARLHADKPRSVRERHARTYAAQFAETYPKFFEMCANASTPEEAKTVHTLASIMISQLKRVDDSFDAASSNIGRVLYDQYVKPLDLPQPKKQKK
jgi:hypothetical protein